MCNCQVPPCSILHFLPVVVYVLVRLTAAGGGVKIAITATVIRTGTPTTTTTISEGSSYSLISTAVVMILHHINYIVPTVTRAVCTAM
jgi:hypothetical protein